MSSMRAHQLIWQTQSQPSEISSCRPSIKKLNQEGKKRKKTKKPTAFFTLQAINLVRETLVTAFLLSRSLDHTAYLPIPFADWRVHLIPMATISPSNSWPIAVPGILEDDESDELLPSSIRRPRSAPGSLKVEGDESLPTSETPASRQPQPWTFMTFPTSASNPRSNSAPEIHVVEAGEPLPIPISNTRSSSAPEIHVVEAGELLPIPISNTRSSSAPEIHVVEEGEPLPIPISNPRSNSAPEIQVVEAGERLPIPISNSRSSSAPEIHVIEGDEPADNMDNTSSGPANTFDSSGQPEAGLSSYAFVQVSPWNSLGVALPFQVYDAKAFFHGDKYPLEIDLLSTFERVDGPVRAMAADRRDLLYTASDSANVRVWKKGEPYEAFDAGRGHVSAILYDRSTGRVFSAHKDGRIGVWETPSYEHVATLCLEDEDEPRNLCLGVVGRGVRDLFRPGPGNRKPISSLCLSEDGKYIYCDSGDSTVKAWCADSWQLVDTIFCERRVKAVAAGDHLVFSALDNGSVQMWRRREEDRANQVVVSHTHERNLEHGQGPINVLMYTGSPLRLFAGFLNGEVACWLGKEWDNTKILNRDNGVSAPTCIAVAGMFVFSGYMDGTIRIWRWRPEETRHEMVKKLKLHHGTVNCLAVHDGWDRDHDGGGNVQEVIMYSACDEERSLRVWRISNR